jgi:hypothetical protein
MRRLQGRCGPTILWKDYLSFDITQIVRLAPKRSAVTEIVVHGQH